MAKIYQVRSPHQSLWSVVSEQDYRQSGFEKREIEVVTRKEYMDSPAHSAPINCPEGKAQRTAAHRRYYAQFVSAETIAYVTSAIGKASILKSTDPYMNDIPLKLWDCLSPPLAMSMKVTGDYLTLAGSVCIAKEAARQWREAQQ